MRGAICLGLERTGFATAVHWDSNTLGVADGNLCQTSKLGVADGSLCQTSLTATAMVEYRSLVTCVPCLPSRKIKLLVKFS